MILTGIIIAAFVLVCGFTIGIAEELSQRRAAKRRIKIAQGKLDQLDMLLNGDQS